MLDAIERNYCKHMQLMITVAGYCDPDQFYFPETLWDVAQTTKQQAQLALFRLIRVDCYLHRHEYAECVSAAEESFAHVGDGTDQKEFQGYVRVAHAGVSYARAALMCRALARGDEDRVREEAREVLRATDRIRHKEWDFLAFVRAYANYLLRNMEAAKAEAVKCARLAGAERRYQLLSMIELEEDYDY